MLFRNCVEWTTNASPAIVVDPRNRTRRTVTLPPPGPPETEDDARSILYIANADGMFASTFLAASIALGLPKWSDVAVYKALDLKGNRVMVFTRDKITDAELAGLPGFTVSVGEIRSLSFHDTCIVVVAPPAPNIRKEKPSQMANGDVMIGMDNLLDVSVLNLAIEAKELAWVWLDADPRPAPRSESEHVVKNYDGFAKLAFKESNPCYSCGAPCSKKCTRCRGIFYCSKECQQSDWKRHKRVCHADR